MQYPYISCSAKNKQLMLSNKIVKIKQPSEISRKPKSIFQKGEYKANELRNLLLFYLPFSLTGSLATKYVKHFELFSSSMYMLLQESITLDQFALCCAVEQTYPCDSAQ